MEDAANTSRNRNSINKADLFTEPMEIDRQQINENRNKCRLKACSVSPIIIQFLKSRDRFGDGPTEMETALEDNERAGTILSIPTCCLPPTAQGSDGRHPHNLPLGIYPSAVLINANK